METHHPLTGNRSHRSPRCFRSTRAGRTPDDRGGSPDRLEHNQLGDRRVAVAPVAYAGAVHLTFDDVTTSHVQLRILAILRNAASRRPLRWGQNTSRYSSVTRSFRSYGMKIGNHTRSHPGLTTPDPVGHVVLNRMEKTPAPMQKATLRTPTLRSLSGALRRSRLSRRLSDVPATEGPVPTWLMSVRLDHASNALNA